MNIELAKPNLEGNLSLEKTIHKRVSIRRFKSKPIEIEKISQLLWGAQALKGQNRTVPSAGGTYPLEFYVNLKDKGLFYYNYKQKILEQDLESDISTQLGSAALGQMFISQAPLIIIICADYSRTRKRYGERGTRYVHIEVGHSAQNIHLQAVSLGLGSVPIGAFNDKEVKSTLNLPKELDPIYIIPIGYPK